MKKFGILVGVGILATLLIGNLKAYGDHRRSLDAKYTNTGREEISDPIPQARSGSSNEASSSNPFGWSEK